MCYTNLQIKHYTVLYQPTYLTLLCVIPTYKSNTTICYTNPQIKHYSLLYQPTNQTLHWVILTYKSNTIMCYTNLHIKHYYVLYQPTYQTLLCVIPNYKSYFTLASASVHIDPDLKVSIVWYHEYKIWTYLICNNLLSRWTYKPSNLSAISSHINSKIVLYFIQQRRIVGTFWWAAIQTSCITSVFVCT